MAFPWASVPGWVLQVLTPAAKTWFAERAVQKGFERAVDRTFHAFSSRHPELRSALFDESFLKQRVVPLLSSFLESRGALPDVEEVAEAWRRQFSIPPEWGGAMGAATDLLKELQVQLVIEKALWPLLDRLAWDRTALAAVRTAEGVVTLADQNDRDQIDDCFDKLFSAAQAYRAAVERSVRGDNDGAEDQRHSAGVNLSNGRRRLMRMRYAAVDHLLAKFQELVLEPYEAAMEAIEAGGNAQRQLRQLEDGIRALDDCLLEAP